MPNDRTTLSEGLLDQARHLATVDPRRPRTANLRRAISTNYYALFHFLIGEAAQFLIGGREPHRRRMRRQLVRTFEHRRMRAAALGFSGEGRDGWVPQIVAVPLELVDCARVFSDLQQDRHSADYDPDWPFGRSEVLNQIESAQRVFDNWPKTRGHPATDAFLVALLIKPRS